MRRLAAAVQGVPLLRGALASEAHRFVTLVDVLYEHRIRVFISAADDPVQLFAKILSVSEARGARVRLFQQRPLVYLLDYNL